MICDVCKAAKAWHELGPGGQCATCRASIEAAESVRLDALALAMACPRDEVNPHTLAAAAGVLPSQWHEVTVERINTKRDAVRAAVAVARGRA